jgi:hypothetical protein
MVTVATVTASSSGVARESNVRRETTLCVTDEGDTGSAEVNIGLNGID